MVTFASRPTPLGAEDGFPTGPRRLLLIGPPGTGKTTSALRSWIQPALQLIESSSPGDAVLICSFGRKATEDLIVRIEQVLGISASAARSCVSTIHSEANRRYGKRKKIYTLGRGFLSGSASAEPQLPDDDDQESLTRSATKVPRSASADPLIARFGWKHAATAFDLYDYARVTCRVDDLDAIVHERRPSFSVEAVRAFIDAYEEYKALHNALDYTDMLELAANADDAQIPDRCLLVVDEAQDCNELQFRALERWAKKSEFFICIGDPDQRIYSFAGADGARFDWMIREGFALRRLTQSHRVPRIAHRFAQRVIRRVKARIDVDYAPAARDGSVYTLSHAQAVSRVLAAIQCGASSMLLARTRDGAARWHERLRSAAIPAVLETKSSLDAPAEIEPSLRACLEAINDLRAGHEPAAESIVELVRHLPVRRPHARFFAENRRPIVVLEPGRSMREVMEHAGIDLRPLVDAPSFADAVKVAGLSRRLPSEARDRARLGMGAFENKSITRVTTFHRSKGREADLVVVDMSVPPRVKREAAMKPALIDEERRLLYVALTRTGCDLILVGNAYSTWLGG